MHFEGTGYTYELDVECERKTGVKNDLKVSDWAAERMELEMSTCESRFGRYQSGDN